MAKMLKNIYLMVIFVSFVWKTHQSAVVWDGDFLLETESEYLDSTCSSLRSLDEQISTETFDCMEGKKLAALQDGILSARTLVCRALDKTDFLLKKLKKLKETPMFNACLNDLKCNDVLPALHGLADHMNVRNETIKAALMAIRSIENNIGKNHHEYIVEEIHMVLFDVIMQNINIISSFVKLWIPDFVPFKMYTTTILSAMLMLYFFRSTAKMIFNFLIKFLLMLCVIVTLIIVASIALNQSNIPCYSIRDTFKTEVSLFTTKHFVNCEIFEPLEQSANTGRNLEAFKAVLTDTYKADKESTAEMQISFAWISEYFKKELEPHLRQLKTPSGKYDELMHTTERFHLQFRRDLLKLIETMIFSRRFYQYVVAGFEAIIESKESFSKHELLFFLKEVLSKSKVLENKYSKHKSKMLILSSKLNQLGGEINEFSKSNKNTIIGAGMAATVLLFVSAVVPPLGLGLGLPAAALSGTGYFGYKAKEAHDDNVVLDNVDKFNVRIKDYSKETLIILENLDPMKITKSIEALEETDKKETISTNAFTYFLSDAQDMAKENLEEIKKVIDEMVQLYTKESQN